MIMDDIDIYKNDIDIDDENDIDGWMRMILMMMMIMMILILMMITIEDKGLPKSTPRDTYKSLCFINK